MDAGLLGGHVGSLGDCLDTVFDHRFGFVGADLVLCCARQCHISFDNPRAFTGVEGRTLELFDVVLDTTPSDVLEFLYPINLFLGKPIGVMDESTRIRKG